MSFSFIGDLLNSSLFLRSYGLIPHRLVNGVVAGAMRARRPRWLIARAIDTWIRVADVNMDESEETSFDSIESFFLRRLRPGARPLGEGFVSPVDGLLLARGRVTAAIMTLTVKRQRILLDHLVGDAGSTGSDAALRELKDGYYATIFLTPSSYHHIHMPLDGEIVECRWVPGRSFPQNERALAVIPRVYHRNERVALRCRSATGMPFLLVLIGAGLVGGIHLEGLCRKDWMRSEATAIGRRARKGSKIAHFHFGSTVVMVVPSCAQAVAHGKAVKMGESMFALTE
jgi:phosphatidylserine decarboxylase